MTRHGRIHRGRRARRRPPGVSWPPLPQRNIPDATVHTSLVDMIAGYPHLTRSRQGRADPAGLRRVNSTSRLRWRLLQLISTGRSVLLRAALFAFLMSSSGSPPSRSGDDVPMRWGSAAGAPLMWVIDNPSTVVGSFALMFVAAIALPLPGQPRRVQRLTHAAKRIAAVPLAGQIVGLAVPWLEWLTAIGAIILAGIAGSLACRYVDQNRSARPNAVAAGLGSAVLPVTVPARTGSHNAVDDSLAGIGGVPDRHARRPHLG